MKRLLTLLLVSPLAYAEIPTIDATCNFYWSYSGDIDKCIKSFKKAKSIEEAYLPQGAEMKSPDDLKKDIIKLSELQQKLKEKPKEQTADEVFRDNLVGKRLVNSSHGFYGEAKSYLNFNKDGSFVARIEGHGVDGVDTFWDGAYVFNGQDVTIYSDIYECRYTMRKVGKFFKFSILFSSNRNYGNICADLLMKYDGE